MENTENKTENPQQTTPNLGGLNIPAASPVGSNPSATAGSAAEGVIAKRKYTKRAANPEGSAAKSGAGVPVLSPEQFKALYSPELWGRIASAPANAAQVATGSKIWSVTDEERKTIGEPCSIAAACFASSDPRWLALTAAFIALANMYGTKLAMYMAEKREQKQAAAKNNPA